MNVRSRVGILVVAGVLALSGCGAETSDSSEVSLPNSDVGIMVDIDGVQCVVVNGHRSSAVSCNWDAYNSGTP